MSRRDWSDTTRQCPGCQRPIQLDSEGRFPMHYRHTATGRPRVCLSSRANALTSADLGRPTRRIR